MILSMPSPLIRDVHADFVDGAKCVAVLESVVASKKSKGWTKVATIK